MGNVNRELQNFAVNDVTAHSSLAQSLDSKERSTKCEAAAVRSRRECILYLYYAFTRHDVSMQIKKNNETKLASIALCTEHVSSFVCLLSDSCFEHEKRAYVTPNNSISESLCKQSEIENERCDHAQCTNPQWNPNITFFIFAFRQNS